jgi:hypothetical protein
LRARSQLLQRAACERALGVPFPDAVLSHTKGRKPFLVRVHPAQAAHQAGALTRAAVQPRAARQAARAKLEL